MRPDEGMIHAWLDGELTPEEGAEMERRMASDPEWAAAVAEARGLIVASSRIVGALDAVPGRVIPGKSSAMPHVRRPARRFQVRPWMGLAAGLVLTVGTALVVWSPESVNEVARLDTESDAVKPLGAAAQATDSAVPAAPPPRRVPAPAGARDVAPLRGIAPPEMRVASGAGEVTRPVAEPTTAPIGPQPPAPTVPPVAQPPLLQSSQRSLSQGPAGAALTADAGGAAAENRARADDGRERLPVAESEIRRQRASRDERAGAAANLAVRDEPMRAMARPSAAGLTGKVSDVLGSVLSGCWRIAPPFTPDTILRDLTISSRRGDTLVVVLSRTREVTVTQRGDTLSGELSAIRTECPSDRSPDPE